MSVQTPDIVELEHQCEIISRRFGFEIEWSKSRKIDAEGASHTKLLAPTGQESSNNTLDSLNDDCLRAIFNSPEIDTIDLMALANICERFEAIAIEVFHTKKPRSRETRTNRSMPCGNVFPQIWQYDHNSLPR